MEQLNYNQVADSTDDELMQIYMKCKKKELAKMLIQWNRTGQKLAEIPSNMAKITNIALEHMIKECTACGHQTEYGNNFFVCHLCFKKRRRV